MNNKLPLWKDRKVTENSQPVSDEELATRVKHHHANCAAMMKKIKKFTNENK